MRAVGSPGRNIDARRGWWRERVLVGGLVCLLATDKGTACCSLDRALCAVSETVWAASRSKTAAVQSRERLRSSSVWSGSGSLSSELCPGGAGTAVEGAGEGASEAAACSVLQRHRRLSGLDTYIIQYWDAHVLVPIPPLQSCLWCEAGGITLLRNPPP